MQRGIWPAARQRPRPDAEIDGGVVSAAKVLGVAVTEHRADMARASAAVDRIDDVVAKVERRGDMKFFNAEFRKRRLPPRPKGGHL